MTDAVPSDSTVRNGASPLSAAQQRQWVADRSLTDPPDNVVLGWRVCGPLDTTALRSALTSLVEWHPALRTRLSPYEVIPHQMVSAAAEYDLTVIGQLPGTAGPYAVEAVLRRPFDLTRGPLVRAVVSGHGDDASLSLAVPRIVCDPHSAGVLSADLAALYRASLTGEPGPAPRPPRIPVQQSPPDRLDGQLAFWRRRLADLPTSAALPADLPRPPVHTQRSRTVFIDVPRDPVHRLGGQGAADTVTFTVFGAALAALLARYSRSRDVVFATQTPGARPPGSEATVGCLANLLPLRIDGSDGPSLRTLVDRVHEAARSAIEHSAVPFQQLVGDLAVDREPSRHPIAQVALDVWPMAGAEAQSARGLRPELVPPLRSPFDVSLAVVDTGDAYAVGFSCNADLFTADAAERMAGHFRRLLADGLAHPDRPLSQLDMLSRAERQVAVAANRTTPTPAATVLDLFERQVADAGGDTALWNPPYRRSFAELDAEAQELADHLAGLGVRPEDRVAVFLPRGPLQVVAMLAVLKAGGAYVPLDPAHPLERIEFVLRDSEARLLLTDQQLSGRLPDGIARLHIDAPLPAATGQPPKRPTVSPDNLAYVIYTSGSTGVPKGVAVTHQCVVRLVCGLDRVDVGPDDTLLMLAPTAFDASTFEVWSALCNGARLAIHPPGPVGPRELGAELRRLGVTVLWLTAQLANLVADVHPQALEPVRTLVVGGEALSVPHLRALLGANPGLRIVNGYGPTETTTFATTHPVVPEQLDETTEVPIGRPVGGTRCYIVDDAGHPVPVGVLGELLVGGAGVARGYLRRPGLTAERFVPDPFGPPGGRLYRTGDLARLRADGVIEFAGRVDDQVKLRGFRIEPGEVRAVLVGHPAVRDAFVTVSGSGLAAELVAYVVPAEQGDADGGALRTYLRDRLPEPLIPARFVSLDRLPLTTNGKVDRRALPDPMPGHRGPAARRRAPSSPWEKTVGDVWTTVLGRSPTDVGEDFFALGGTSLDLVRVAAELAEQYGTTVPLYTLFRLRTVAELAAALAADTVSASDRR
ncbi:non-ribosomal peptide synthetase [Streptomyces sp. NBC_01236]|uniref:non-ribosomal peptide synthetase n=1 Tax=Streptomyces sp. NBC_01236 TaxID=2903789 RepID=UPI002E1567EF|nr:amino acid adenylation domain-containing protein [Streptomyces sp. NBC_01236]